MDILYNEAIDPNRLFHSEEEVEEFINIDPTLEHLYCFLKFCEEKECYEFCAIIYKRIKEEELKQRILCY